jgi:nitrilase
MRVSVMQMTPGDDKAENIAQASRLIAAAVDADRPDIVSLPEMWTCLGGSRTAKHEQAETLPAYGSNEPGGAAYEFLRGVARSQRITVHGGSLGEAGGEKLFNTTVVFDPDGAEIARYRKIHMFDIVAPDGKGYRESAVYGAGSEVVTYEAQGVKVGCAICYDVRFPEMFLALRRAGAELIFLPSAFTLQTGKDHWEVLIRARAIETQCWIAAPATYGKHLDAAGEARMTYGHSLLCDPWGQVVAKASDGIGWATARIDQALTVRIRRDMPILEHRVLDHRKLA